MSAVAGLVLAAGAGRRLGTPKGLVELGGEPLVHRAVRLLRGGGCAPVAVVVGAAGDEVAALVGEDADVVPNPGWASGMASSVRAGLTALERRCDAVVIALVDQPEVGEEAVRRLVAAWREGARIAVATYDGQPRNPVLFDASTWDALRGELEGDRGAGPFLARHPALVTRVACDGTGSPRDVDTPADLRIVT